MKEKFLREKYKVFVLVSIIGIMLVTLVKVYRHPVSDVATQIIDGYSMTFLKLTTITLFLLIVICFLVLISVIKHKKIEQMFLFMGILFGALYMFLLPPFTVPDEATHLDTTYYFSSKLLGEDAVDEEGYVLYRSDDVMFNHGEQHIPTAKTYAMMFHNLFRMDHSEDTATTGRGPLAVPAVSYIPQIIGVTLARLLGLGNILMLLLGRMFALAFYLVCVYWAIRMAPIGKEVLMVVGLMPMTLQMAGSFSYDSVVLALCFLYTGILLYLTFEAPSVTWKHILLLAVLFAWMSPVKLVYVCLAFAMLIIPADKFSDKRMKYLMILGVIAAGAIAILLTRFHSVTAIGTGEGTLEGQNLYSINYLLDNPTKVLTMTYGTIVGRGTYYLETMIGQYLGWLEILVPGYIIYGFYTLIVLASIRRTDELKVFSAGQKLWIFLIVAGSTVMICAALLFDCTPIDSNYIYGIQGRYFLPMLPLLMMLCKNNQIEMKQTMAKYIATGVYVLQYLTVYHVYASIIAR